MQIKNTYRSISLLAIAALVASVVTILSGTSDKVVASAPLNSGKGDRLDIRPLGVNCSEQAWPYFEAGCMRDRRAAQGQVKAARVVTADRIDVKRATR